MEVHQPSSSASLSSWPKKRAFVEREENPICNMKRPSHAANFLTLVILTVSISYNFEIANSFTAFTYKKSTTRHGVTAQSRARLYFRMSSSSNNRSSSSSGISRRKWGDKTFATLGSVALVGSFAATREIEPTDYGLFGVLPVGPYKRKKTIRRTIVPDKLWSFDQKFGILNVQVPLRMTVIKLSSGGLFIYNPIAATPEVRSLLQELIVVHGKIKHIILGSVAAEHKVYAGVFAQKFSGAKVWVQPGQYSYPVNLPNAFLGFPPGRTFMMPFDMNDNAVPEEWKADFEFLTLGPFISRDGAFGETVFFHKDTETLLVTDTVLEVTEDVPDIYDDDPKPLLYHARDTINDRVEDTYEVRKRGWRRIVLFGLFFTPSAIYIKDASTALRERRPDINSDFAGIYPWDWTGNDVASFNALRGGLLVAPILQQLILNRNPIEVLDFADEVSKWPFKRIIPVHLKNDLEYRGKDYRNAFSFLEAGGVPPGLPKPLDADMKTLRDANESLLKSGAISKVPPFPGGKDSRSDIIAQSAHKCRGGVCTPSAPLQHR